MNIAGTSYTVSKNIALKASDTTYLRRAHVNNLAEDKKTKMHILKLQKALNIRCREIDKEKAALKKFYEKASQDNWLFSSSTPLVNNGTMDKAVHLKGSIWKHILSLPLTVFDPRKQYKKPLRQVKKEKKKKKDYTVEDTNGTPTKESTDIS